ncbi:MAG: hypothetical protein H6923_02730 [Alphaproteobacteria bacterium]|nr:hypothetical protein [Alphaproteobacteria bacterium]
MEMTPDVQNLLLMAVVTVAAGFLVYRRVRRSVGRQRFRAAPLVIRSTVMALAALTFVALAPKSPETLEFAAGGAGIGLGLALYALSHTRFEFQEGEIFYTGHPLIGLGVSAIFIARLGYSLIRMPQMMTSAAHAYSPGSAAAVPSPVSSPLTLAAFLLMAAYYIVYGIGLFRGARRLEKPTA